MSDKRYYLSNFTKEQLAEMCAAEDARTDGRVHLAYALQAENDKLRELCGEILLYIAYPYVCVRPSVLIERARDLGIEVDG